ncbi:MAG: formylglycine-generating enzyme family protein [Saprospiraceae bacterium]|nr:formylglycine-generating enzyme family protein [Saprospiraceae bacterium]
MSPAPILPFTINHHRFHLLLVEGDTFRMGNDKASDPDAYGDEAPPHDVTVPSFYLAQYPVTQALWVAVMGREEDREPYFTGENRPMVQVSWHDAKEFLEKLKIATDLPFRLPSEAEWEFAARGGVFNSGLKYAGSQRLKEVGWYAGNSHGETKPVGCKLPNELGLYDMSGNVREWCEDDWHGNYKNAPADGSAWIDKGDRGSLRVLRGSSWGNNPQNCRSAFRYVAYPGGRGLSDGLRLALSLQ